MTPATSTDVDETEIPISARVAPTQFLIDDNGVYTADTTDAGDAGAADLLMMPASETATEDGAIFGFTSPFGAIALDNAGGTAGVGGTITWQYWNGTAWAALSGVLDGTAGFTAAASDNQVVSWDVPTDWATQSLDSGASLYHVRALVATVFSTNPVYDQAWIMPKAGRPITLRYAVISNPGANFDHFKIFEGSASDVVPADDYPEFVVGVPAGSTVTVYLGDWYCPNGATMAATNESGPGATAPGTGFSASVFYG